MSIDDSGDNGMASYTLTGSAVTGGGISATMTGVEDVTLNVVGDLLINGTITGKCH